MTDHERAILLSFLEARPAYLLRAYFDEIDRLYGSFAAYMREGPAPHRRGPSRASAPWWPRTRSRKRHLRPGSRQPKSSGAHFRFCPCKCQF